MNKRIEVGCLVILFGLKNKPEDNGKVFTVMGRCKQAEEFRPDKCWWLDDGEWSQERHMTRIDDHTEETETQEEEMVV